MLTPWGQSDCSVEYGPGVTFYGTPSHGGFHLSPEREAELDMRLREHGITAEAARMGYEPGWYEEDCSAYAVVVAFPELFPSEDSLVALACLRYWLGLGES